MQDDVKAVELAPCPLDNAPAEWEKVPYRGTGASGMESPELTIRCTKCRLRLPPVRTEKWEQGKGTFSTWTEAEQRLASQWNARPALTALQERCERLENGLKLAANRLDRCAVEVIAEGKTNQYEWWEWANEARAALKDSNNE